MKQKPDQMAGLVLRKLPFLQIFFQIIRMNFLLIDQLPENMAFLFCFCTVVVIQFLFADKKSGNTFRKLGKFANLLRISGDTDNSNNFLIMADRKVDTLLSSGKTVAFTYFN